MNSETLPTCLVLNVKTFRFKTSSMPYLNYLLLIKLDNYVQLYPNNNIQIICKFSDNNWKWKEKESLYTLYIYWSVLIVC